jgi:DNA-binding transcriptional LysR family regulator
MRPSSSSSAGERRLADAPPSVANLVDQGWLGVEARHLAVFEAVARERSFGRAARQLGYTQSAVSGQIAALERLVGERLLERHRGSAHVELTSAGQVLLSHASAITARLQAARADIEALGAADVVRLRIGIHQSIGRSLLPSLVAAFASELPHAELVLHEAGTERNLQWLVAHGELDLAFSVPPVRSASIASFVLLREPFVLLRPHSETGRPIDLSRLPLVAFEPCTSQRAVEERLEELGLSLAQISRLEDTATIHAFVDAGTANALLPRLALTGGDVDVTLLSELPRRTVLLIWQADRVLPAEAHRFVELAGNAAAALDVTG